MQGRGDKRQLLVRVSDQGMGIPSEDLERVFERFYRVENEITQGMRGVGLGLAVCRGIVEAHGGRIWAESTLGVGSTLYFTLPVLSKVEGPVLSKARPEPSRRVEGPVLSQSPERSEGSVEGPASAGSESHSDQLQQWIKF
jgi:DNA topoisomerase VI subunit B